MALSPLIPILVAAINTHWPDMPMRSMLAAQVEQESGWKIDAELKTKREYGAGLGQFTRTYRSNGSTRFDAVSEMVSAHPALRGWSWKNVFEPRYQLAALVLKNRDNYRAIQWASFEFDQLAMTDAAYNSGVGAVRNRRALCLRIPGCDPSKWFGNLEHASTQSRIKAKGYGQSFAEITNAHVRNVMIVRRPKYINQMGT